ncbi:MAG: NAD(P)H-dependent oxidoreductase [Actinomycetota bacterium]
MTKILRIDSSARSGDSVSRELTQRLVGRLTDAASGDVEVATRDLAAGVPFLSESTLQAMWTPEADRTPEQNAQLTVADEFIRELAEADAVVFGLPIYNFGPPAVVKAWADLVARAGTTFRYTESGPEGLVTNRPTYVVVASGGVPIGSPMDLSSTWLVTFLNFLGITDVTIVEAGQLNVDPEQGVADAPAAVDAAPLPTAA